MVQFTGVLLLHIERRLLAPCKSWSDVRCGRSSFSSDVANDPQSWISIEMFDVERTGSMGLIFFV
jgi:hypothetical protein